MASPRTVLSSSGYTDVIVEAPPGWAEGQDWSLVLSDSVSLLCKGKDLASD